jgi:hypothetical protein
MAAASIGRRMNIFIAGCARSGTTLLRNLMACFDDTYCHGKEARASKFKQLGSLAPNIVVKRTAESHQNLPELAHTISLIYCLRHPVDVLTSTHPTTKHLRRFHVTPERWDQEYAALKQLQEEQPQRAICYVRYEDLIRTPDDVQQRIAQAFGLSEKIRFRDDPRNPIVDKSLEKWRTQQEFLAYVQSLPSGFLKRLAAFCDEFGYEKPWEADRKVLRRILRERAKRLVRLGR